MVPNERLANKLLGVFADLRLTTFDMDRVAFYMVQNAVPHDDIIARVKTFGNQIQYHDARYTEYQHDTLF